MHTEDLEVDVVSEEQPLCSATQIQGYSKAQDPSAHAKSMMISRLRNVLLGSAPSLPHVRLMHIQSRSMNNCTYSMRMYIVARKGGRFDDAAHTGE